MCSRYSNATDLTQLAKAVELVFYYTMLAARYNIAPTQSAPVIVMESQKPVLKMMRWGLIPSWAKVVPAGNPLTNARQETLRAKPSFREALEQRRCLVPADGYYEWKDEAGKKQPFRVQLKSGEPFCFAGLWERWLKPAGPETTDGAPDRTVESFTIITTQADQRMAPLHHRMPVMVPPEHYRLWLENQSHREPLPTVLDDAPPPRKIYPVSQFVNSAANDDARCVEPAEISRDLFEKPWWEEVEA